MKTEAIEEKLKKETLHQVKQILEKVNNNTISLNELKDYYSVIAGAFINKDINNNEYMNALTLLKKTKIKDLSENKKELYNQIEEVLDEQIEKCAERIINKKYKKIIDLKKEPSIKVIDAKLFIKLCEEFDYSEIKQVEGVNYIEWAKILESLNPICVTPEEIQTTNNYKNALEKYIEQKTK